MCPGTDNFGCSRWFYVISVLVIPAVYMYTMAKYARLDTNDNNNRYSLYNRYDNQESSFFTISKIYGIFLPMLSIQKQILIICRLKMLKTWYDKSQTSISIPVHTEPCSITCPCTIRYLSMRLRKQCFI